MEDWDAMKATLGNVVWSDVLVDDDNTHKKNINETMSYQRRFFHLAKHKCLNWKTQYRRAAGKKSRA